MPLHLSLSIAYPFLICSSIFSPGMILLHGYYGCMNSSVCPNTTHAAPCVLSMMLYEFRYFGMPQTL